MTKFENKTKVNSQISAKSVLVIDEDGAKLGSFNLFDALKLSSEKGLDLIEISHDKNISQSVVKIGDYGKYLYEKKKKEKAQDKQQRQSAIDLKEIQLRPTDAHDIEIKAKKTLKFLEDGDKVKVILQMFNREITRKSVGEEKIKEFLVFIDSELIEKDLHQEGNNLVVVLFKKRK